MDNYELDLFHRRDYLQYVEMGKEKEVIIVAQSKRHITHKELSVHLYLVIVKDLNGDFYGLLKLPDNPGYSGNGNVEWFTAISDNEAELIAIEKAKENKWL